MLMSGPQCFAYCSFVLSFEISKCESSDFDFHFQNCFGFLGHLAISYEFEDWHLHVCYKDCWNFGKDCVESVDSFGSIDI